jgi:hypothetical protein
MNSGVAIHRSVYIPTVSLKATKGNRLVSFSREIMRFLICAIALAATFFTRTQADSGARTHYVHSSCRARDGWQEDDAMFTDLVRYSLRYTSGTIPRDIIDAARDVFRINPGTSDWKWIRGLVKSLYMTARMLKHPSPIREYSVLGTSSSIPKRRVCNAQGRGVSDYRVQSALWS